MKKLKLYVFLIGVFGSVFIISSYMVFKNMSNAQREKKNFNNLSEIIELDLSEYNKSEKIQNRDILPQYVSLKERNSDFFGWISIEGTKLNYPVMYTPNDPEYYLHRDFDKPKSQSGVPFLSASYYEGCGNYLIYGHNIKNGSMFASILSYADPEYWRQHPLIQFNTLTELGEYEVMAAFYSKAYTQNEKDVFRYYEYTDISDSDIFERYIKQINEVKLYDTGVNAVYGDKILTLSTCSYHTQDGRFVVVARKKKQ